MNNTTTQEDFDNILPRIDSQDWPGGLVQYRAACQVALIAWMEGVLLRMRMGNDGG